MSSTLFGGVDRLEQAMDFHRERHSVLAGNVANVDTPGYRPLDLEPVEPIGAAGSLSRTDTQHLTSSGVAGAQAVFTDDGQAPGLDGNTVDLHRELAKVDANRLRYTATAELASRRLGLLRYAAGDGSGG